MGFFSKTKLDVKLHVNTKPSYTNEDIITGDIEIVSNSSSDRVINVKIILVGKCTTEVSYLADLSSRKKIEEVHHVIYRGKELFPYAGKSELQFPGRYRLPFEVQIPGHGFHVSCIEKGLHAKVFNVTCAAFETYDLPPSFEFHGAMGNAKVEYFVKAIVSVSDDVKQSVTRYNPIRFFPTDSCTSFCKAHSKSSPRSDTQVTFGMKYTVWDEVNKSRHSMASLPSLNSEKTRSRSNTLHSVVSHKRALSTSFMTNKLFEKIEFPLVLDVEFKQNVSMNFDSKGIVYAHTPLNQFLSLRLSTYADPYELAEQVDEDTLTLTNFQIRLMSNVYVRADKMVEEFAGKRSVVTKEMPPLEVQLSQLKETAIESEFGVVQRQFCYVIDQSYYSDQIAVQVPSFDLCNLRNEYQLQVSFDVTSAITGHKKNVKMQSDIVLLAK